jgi:hypothetical protein
MDTNWHKGMNPNLERLAQLLGMSGGAKPSHGYTVAEKAPEVVTAPGVYFPAEKGEVIPLESKQLGGSVIPSLLDFKSRKPYFGEGASKVDIFSMGSPGSPPSTSPPGPEAPINPKTSFNERVSSYGSPGWFGSEKQVAGGQSYSPFAAKEELTPRAEGGGVTPALLEAGNPNPTAPAFNSEEAKMGILDKVIKSMSDVIKSVTSAWETPKTGGSTAGEMRRNPEQGPGFWQADIGMTPTTGGINPTTTGPKPADTKPVDTKPIENKTPLDTVNSYLKQLTTMFSRQGGGVVTPPVETTEEELKRLRAGMTVGPERFFAGEKEVPAGTLGAVSGDELARERILREATPDLRLPKVSYYEAHPEEAKAQEIYDLLRPPGPSSYEAGVEKFEKSNLMDIVKERVGRFEKPTPAAAGAPALIAGIGKTREEQEATAGKAAALASVPTRKGVLPSGIGTTMGAPKGASPLAKLLYEKSNLPPDDPRHVFYDEAIKKTASGVSETPTSLKLIQESLEKGPDGQPTPKAKKAQATIDKDAAMKLEASNLRQQGAIEAKTRGINQQALADKITGKWNENTGKFDIPPGESIEGVKNAFGVPIQALVQSLVAEQNPKFDFIKSDANKKFIDSPANLRILSLVQASYPRVASLLEKADALGNISPRTANLALNAIRREFGGKAGEAVVDFESMRNAIISEVNTALTGSSTGSDYRVRLELQNMATKNTLGEQRVAINNLLSALDARADASTGVPYPWEEVTGHIVFKNAKERIEYSMGKSKGGESTENLRKKYNY